MPSTKKSGKGMMHVEGLTGQIVYGLLLACIVLDIPLPGILLDHELGLLTQDPAHTRCPRTVADLLTE